MLNLWFFPMVFTVEWRPVKFFFFVQADTTIVVVFPSKDLVCHPLHYEREDRDNKDEMINHIVSEWSKLIQKEYKTRHEWVGDMIHWELCKRFKFDRTNNRYLFMPESAVENEIRNEIRKLL